MVTPSANGLTARARIRDAALALFGDHGYAGASIRDIAEAAGVSPSLIQHHFGSKDGLREACDEYALVTFRGTNLQGIEAALYADLSADMADSMRAALDSSVTDPEPLRRKRGIQS